MRLYRAAWLVRYAPTLLPAGSEGSFETLQRRSQVHGSSVLLGGGCLGVDARNRSVRVLDELT